ncbi:MAG: hypothetical protein L0G70_11475, partial [Rubrobacter sp.]|nr:hypothetical protein [Rubrobacter sp.]
SEGDPVGADWILAAGDETASEDEPAAGDETANEDETADGDRSVWPFPSSADESDDSEPDNRRPRVK